MRGINDADATPIIIDTVDTVDQFSSRSTTGWICALASRSSSAEHKTPATAPARATLIRILTICRLGHGSSATRRLAPLRVRGRGKAAGATAGAFARGLISLARGRSV